MGKNGTREALDTTTAAAIKTLNKEMPGLYLTVEYIDMCHRLGKKTETKNRQIIVKFTSRLVRNKVLRS